MVGVPVITSQSFYVISSGLLWAQKKKKEKKSFTHEQEQRASEFH